MTQEDKIAFTSTLNDLAETEIDRDSSLLSRDRGKAATLMQGAVDRSSIYKGVESSLDALIAEHLDHVESVAREIRSNEIGEEAAAEEEKLGNKPDEEYAKEAIFRRKAREKQKEREEARKRREEEVERLRSLEEKKKAELDKLRRADERRRENQAKEEQRVKNREAHRALLKQKEKEEELRREERRKEEMSRNRARDRSIDRTRLNDESEGTLRSREPPRHDSRTRLNEKPATPPPASPVDEKALEVAALELLLREGRELAAKSGPRVEQERSESLELPSLRKSSSVKPPKLGEPSPPEGPSADRSRSPQKTIVFPKGPKLSYSQIRRPAASPPQEPTPRSRSRSHTRHLRESMDESYNKPCDSDPKTAWTRHTSSRYEAEDGAHKGPRDHSRPPTHRDEDQRSNRSRQTSSHHRNHIQDDYYSRDCGRQEDRDRYQDNGEEKYHSSRDLEYERRKDRSLRDYQDDKDRYRSFRNRSRDRDPDRDHAYDRDRDRDRERRYERSGRSRSGERSTHHRATGYIETRGPRNGDRPRAKSPVEIDRYVPSTSSRAKELEPRSHHERSKLEIDGAEAEVKSKERERYVEKDRYAEKEKNRDRRDMGKDSYAERDRYGERGRDKGGEKERYAERERETKPWVDIDRYVPGGGDRGRERDRDRERDRERERDRGKERSR